MLKLNTYVVRQGDHLLGIAARNGFDADEVWSDPANAELKALRGTHNLLLPGDVLQIPCGQKWVAIATGATNKFTAPVKTCTITHSFFCGDDPMANVKYRVIGGMDEATPKATDASGTATFEVSVFVESVRIVFESGLSYVLKIGHLDPVATYSGAAQRLMHLGYLGTSDESVEDEGGREDRERCIMFALSSFQTDNGIPSTGEIDVPTSQKLAEVYGC